MNEEDNIALYLTPQEAQNIVQVLGQLPTSSNAWPLLMKIAQQLQEEAQEGETE